MDKVEFEFKINNKYYNEYYARYLLEYFFTDIFKNAKVVDRPDIWVEAEGEHKSIGVEVTTLLDTYYNTLKRYKRAWAEKGLSLEQITKVIPALLKNKVGINSHGNLILLGKNKSSPSRSLTGLETTIKIKLEKLQGYRSFDLNNLFVFVGNLNPECTVEKIFEKIKQIKTAEYPKIFNYIMIFNYDELQVYPFSEKGLPEIYKVSEETRFFCDKLAEIEEQRISTKLAAKKNRNKGKVKKVKDKSLGDED